MLVKVSVIFPLAGLSSGNTLACLQFHDKPCNNKPFSLIFNPQAEVAELPMRPALRVRTAQIRLSLPGKTSHSIPIKPKTNARQGSKPGTGGFHPFRTVVSIMEISFDIL